MAGVSVGSLISHAFTRRERSGVLTSATLAYWAVAVGLFAVFAALMWRDLIAYFEWTLSIGFGPASPEAFMPPVEVRRFIALYTGAITVFYVIFAAYEACCLRWLVGQQTTPGFFGLGFGKDTWNVVLVYLTWIPVYLGAYFAMVLVLFAGIMVSFGLANAVPQDAMDAVTGVLMAVSVLAGLFVFLVVLVRFAPAAALTIGRGDYAFFDAWKATKGRFWSLLGAFGLVMVGYFIAFAALLALVLVSVGRPLMTYMLEGQQADPQALLSAFSNPGVWAPIAVAYGFILLLAAIVWVAFFGINAKAALVAHEEGKV